jgi:CBS domain-containing protein
MPASAITQEVQPGTFDPFASGDRLAEREVREVMSPGVTCISEDASLRDVQRAMLTRNVHAIAVVGLRGGTPLGWVTSRGLLGFVDHDRSMTAARDAIVESPSTISPSASARDALNALTQPGVSHLLVTRAADRWPIGVVSGVDLVGLACR